MKGLHSWGSLTIVGNGTASELHDLSREVARNLHTYFHADVNIEVGIPVTSIKLGNVISLSIGADIAKGILSSHPITISGQSVDITDNGGRVRRYHAGKYGPGAIFLRPLDNERLEVVVWGSNADLLRVAARLMPYITGAGVPDFVVMTKEMLWKGIDGALAMGFFDSSWAVARSSFLT